MPAWLVKIVTALAPTLLNWLSSKIADWVGGVSDQISNEVEERKLKAKQKKREDLTRQLEIAKEKGDVNEIKRLSIAIHLLNAE